MATAVVREPKHQIPDEFCKILMEKHPSGFGYASPQGEVRNDVERYYSDEVDLESTLKQLEKNYKNDRVFYLFGSDGENAQPFDIITNGEEGEKEEVYLSAIVEGDFPKYEGGVVEFANGFLIPLCSEICDLASGDIPLFM